MTRTGFDEYGVEETLDAVESMFLAQLESNADIFVLAAHFADLHCEESATPDRTALRGEERVVRLGGVGTPRVREFAYLEFGARIRFGKEATKHFMADALDCRHRLPNLWAGVTAHHVKVAWARMVATRTRHLSREAAGLVDVAVAESADGRIPFGRFETLVDAKVVEADPDTAVRREAEAAARKFARASRSAPDGMRGFYIRAGLGAIARIDATVAYLAAALAALGDPDNEDERRVKACLILANPHQAVQLLAVYAAHRARHQTGAADHATIEPPPEDDELTLDPTVDPGDPLIPHPFRPGHPPWRPPDPPDGRPPVFDYDPSKLLPTVNLYVHAFKETLESGEGGVCRVEGYGPLSLQWVHDHLRPEHAFRIVPVLDLDGQAPVDAYEIPHRHREAARLLTPADCFPFATQVGRSRDPSRLEMDIDHTIAHPGRRRRRSGRETRTSGASHIGNYGQMVRFHHRVKTHGAWRLKQPFPGIFVWRDPHGRYYLVDHTGTRATREAGANEPRDWNSEIELEIRPTPPNIELHQLGHLTSWLG